MFQVEPTLATQHVACPNCQGVVAIGPVELSSPLERPLSAGQAFSSASPPIVGQASPPESQGDQSAIPTTAAAPQTELLGCPRCDGTFGVTAEMGGQQMACPHCGGVMTIPGSSTPGWNGEAPPAPADMLMAFRVQDRPKKIVMGDRVVEVRRLTAEEKASRRFVKRLVLIGICGAILVGTLIYLLLRTGPKA